MMKISVIIPTYNRIHFISDAIESCRQQILPKNIRVEIVVVDDGSTDKTSELLKEKYTHIIHLLTIPNSERGAARNQGAQYALKTLKSDWLLFLDADDCLDLFGLEGLINKITPGENIISGRYILWLGDEKFGKILPLRPQSGPPKTHLDYLCHDWLPLGATLIHSDLYKLIGGFLEDRKLSGSEDRVFVIHAALAGCVSFTQHIVTWYRQHDENTNMEKFSKSMKFSLQALKPIVKKYFLNCHEKAYKNLKTHVSFLLIGAHNSNSKQGRPLSKLRKLVLNSPSLLFNQKTWKYFFSILKNKIHNIIK